MTDAELPFPIDLKEITKIRNSIIKAPLLVKAPYANFKMRDLKIKKAIGDNCMFLDFLFPRWHENGYPLWYASFKVFDDSLKGNLKLCISEFTTGAIIGVLNSFFERNKELNTHKIEVVAKVIEKIECVEINFIKVLEDIKRISKLYDISLEDATVVYCGEKSNSDTIITRDIPLLRNSLLKRKFTIVMPEHIVGMAPQSLRLSEPYRITPEILGKRMEDVLKVLTQSLKDRFELK